MSKMQIKTRLSKKTLKKIFFGCMCVVVILAMAIVIHIVKYSNYVTVDSLVTNVYTDNGLGNSETTVSRYANVSYTINGENYTTEVRIGALFSGVTEGGTLSINVNPDDYGEIEDTYAFRTLICLTVFMGVFTVCMFFAVLKGKRD